MTLETTARLDFVLGLRRRWADTLYPHLKTEFDASPAEGSVDERVHALPTYPWFAWMERGVQKMLWRAAARAVEEQSPPPPTQGPARLELDGALELPAWYTDWDIHVQPGGVWSSDRAAAIYELGAKLVMLGENDEYGFHRLFAETAVPRRDYRRIVDLGCGFGKSAWPFKRAYPEAEVIGIDLAAPCLALAVRKCDAAGLELRFRQADAAATGLEAGSADLVTATMFVHEVPVDVLPSVFAEAARLLAPGGVLRFLDFQATGDAFRDLAMREHGERNNEPFLPPMMAADLAGMARAAGLADARWVAFDERGAGRLPTLAWPQRAEWHFPWAVLEAEKPA